MKISLKKRRPGACVITQLGRHKNAKYDHKMLLAKKQNFICPLCERNFSKDEPKSLHLDHNHKNGMIRACLCSGCNRSEGKIAGIIKRFLSKVEIDFEQFIRNMVMYWDFHEKNPSNVLHPDFKTKFDKKEKNREKAAKTRKKKQDEKNKKINRFRKKIRRMD